MFNNPFGNQVSSSFNVLNLHGDSVHICKELIFSVIVVLNVSETGIKTRLNYTINYGLQNIQREELQIKGYLSDFQE
jgi:hypothetical protein